MSRFRLMLLSCGVVLVVAIGVRVTTHDVPAGKVTASEGRSLLPPMPSCQYGMDADGCVAAPTPETPLYCVREGHLPETPPGCIVVDKIEDVPPGVVWIPSHGGLTDPDAIRRFWAND